MESDSIQVILLLQGYSDGICDIETLDAAEAAQDFQYLVIRKKKRAALHGRAACI